MKKLFYIANARIPTEKAHGTQIMFMCEALSRHFEVTLIVPSRFNPDFTETDPLEYYGVSGFSVKYIPVFDYIKIESRIGLFVKKILFLLQNILFSFAALVYTWFSGCRLIYTRHIFTGVAASAGRIAGIHYVYESHYIPENRKIFDFVVKHASKVIAITDYLKDELEKLAPCICARDGFAPDIFKPAVIKKADIFTVTYCGHLYSWKGVDDFCRAADLLKDIQFRIVGGTKAAITEYKEKYQNPAIVFEGFVPQRRVAEIIAKSHAVILPNSAKEKISRFYTSPLKLFEYMACKKPIIASDLPSLREVLSQENAVLIEPDSPVAIAEAVRLLKSNPELAQRIAKQAYTDSAQYTWEGRAQKISEFILQ